MMLTTIDDAKNYALKATNKYLSKEESLKKIKELNGYIANSSSDESRDYWVGEKKSLEAWLESEDFLSGNYPQGIDDLVLELIEWRSLIYAIEAVHFVDDPFKKHQIHTRWLSGAAYAILCIEGKLISKDTRDNSLRSLWLAIQEFIVAAGTCSQGEAELIKKKFHATDGHFTNLNSKAILFRNKAIAHNESSPRLEWSDVDKDIELIIRVWSLVVTFCSFGIMFPFADGESAFSGLEGFTTTNELHQLRTKRNEYLDKVKAWSHTNIATGQTNKSSGAFAEFSISFSINGELRS